MQGVATAKGPVAFGSSSLGTLTKAGIGALACGPSIVGSLTKIGR